MNNISWDLFKSFLAVAREKSLSGAARSLGIAQPTVGRHMDLLEQGLGTSLFTRSPSGFMLTDAGKRLIPYAESIASNAVAMAREIAEYSDSIKGTVRITASDVLSVEVLPKILANLRSEHAGLNIELVASNTAKNLLDREADIAIRMFKPTQQALIVRKLGETELGWFAHKSYLKKFGTPLNQADLKKHALIGFDVETDFIRSFKSKIGNIERDDFALRTDNDLVQLSAIRSGFGIGMCQTKIAAKDSNLVRILQKEIGPKLGLWMAMHENLKSSAKYKTVFNTLSTGIINYLNENQ
ncbi:LysR family transcriptional regulator [Bdellovibrio sp. SKB1291214]|uniref:LysR family transcriptional regulator n=1 Tax=Bdellovibrio sp. SKB1291214 TaxID=1732569 RepID=UPI001C3DC009|nr:LysR family transcriptional regulator [Bdellovibrio sp. SKB1291214]UYL09660.1 LysR family transcriptional regulator [Bdellovibrio sp. SKB1291214]